MADSEQATQGEARPAGWWVAASPARSTAPMMVRRRWWGHARAACAVGVASVALGGCAVFGSHPLRADATLRPTPGHTAHGTVALTQRPDGVQVTYDIVGLAPNTAHAFALHQGGDCGGADADHVGPRLELADIVPPGAALVRQRDSSGVDVNRTSPAELARDDALTRIWADATGTAVGFFVLPDMSLDGLRSIVGRTMVVHAGYVDRAAQAASAREAPAPAQTGPALRGAKQTDKGASKQAAKQAGKTPAGTGPRASAASGARGPDAGAAASAPPGDPLDSVHLRWPVPPVKDPAGGALACGIVRR